MKQTKLPENIKETAEKLNSKAEALRRRADECQRRITADVHKRVKNIQVTQDEYHLSVEADLRSMSERLIEQDEKLVAQTKLMKSTEKQLAVQNTYLKFLTSSLVEAKCAILRRS